MSILSGGGLGAGYNNKGMGVVGNIADPLGTFSEAKWFGVKSSKKVAAENAANDAAGVEGSEAPAAADIGTADSVDSVEAQAAQRRLARLSKYFSSPTGVMSDSTASAGVF